MNWFDWLLAAWMIFGTCAMFSQIGKPRDPITEGLAYTVLVINMLIILGLALT